MARNYSRERKLPSFGTNDRGRVMIDLDTHVSPDGETWTGFRTTKENGRYTHKDLKIVRALAAVRRPTTRDTFYGFLQKDGNVFIKAGCRHMISTDAYRAHIKRTYHGRAKETKAITLAILKMFDDMAKAFRPKAKKKIAKA